MPESPAGPAPMSLRALAWRRMQTIAVEVRFDMPSDGLHVTPRRLFELFSYGYLGQACKIAGMRRPRAWSTG